MVMVVMVVMVAVEVLELVVMMCVSIFAMVAHVRCRGLPREGKARERKGVRVGG